MLPKTTLFFSLDRNRILAGFIASTLAAGLIAVPAHATEPPERDKPALCDTYTDVSGHWALNAINWAYKNSIIQGKTANKMAPNELLTRAQMAAMMDRLFGTYQKADISKYTDLVKGGWYYDYIAQAVQMGVLTGYADNTMKPDAPITREQAIVMIARTICLTSANDSDLSDYSDANLVDEYAYDSIYSMVKKEFVAGFANGTLGPQQNITRAQMVQILYRIFSHICEGGNLSGTYNGVMLIQHISNLHDATFKGDVILANSLQDQELDLKNVNIEGRLIVWGGSKINVTGNSKINSIILARNDGSTQVTFDKDATAASKETCKITYPDNMNKNNRVNWSSETTSSSTGGGSGGSSRHHHSSGSGSASAEKPSEPSQPETPSTPTTPSAPINPVEPPVEKPSEPEKKDESAISNDWAKDQVIKGSDSSVHISFQSTVPDAKIVSVESDNPAIILEKEESDPIEVPEVPEVPENPDIPETPEPPEIPDSPSSDNTNYYDNMDVISKADSILNSNKKTESDSMNYYSTASTQSNRLMMSFVVYDAGEAVEKDAKKDSDSMRYYGSESWIVKASAIGSATITAKLSTGESTTFDVHVFDLAKGTDGVVETTVASDDSEKELLEGSSVKTGDLTVDVPIIGADGKPSTISVTPEIPEGTVLKAGDNEIIGMVEIDGVKTEVKLHVNGTNIPMESIAVNQPEDMKVGGSQKLNLNFYPEKTTDSKKVSWESSNPDAVTVDEDGTIHAVGGGSATITATTKGGLTASCDIFVESPMEGISMDFEENQHNLVKGDSQTLKVSFLPEDTTDPRDLTWTSSNPEVATVDENGKVTAVGGGSATITATTKDGKSDSFDVSVRVPLSGITFDEMDPDDEQIELEIDGEKTLKAAFDPIDTTDDTTLTWTSSNPEVATVDENGKITAVGGGTTTITAKTEDGHEVSCSVFVRQPMTGISMDTEQTIVSVGNPKELSVLFAPLDTTDDKTITWTSSDPNVATVDENGVVTALSSGKTTITATCGDFIASCEIQTNTAPVISSVNVKVTPVHTEDGKFKCEITPSVTDAEGNTYELEYDGDYDESGYYDLGHHTVKIRAIDEHGAVSDWFEKEFDVVEDLPLTISTPSQVTNDGVTVTVNNPGNYPIDWKITGPGGKSMSTAGLTDRGGTLKFTDKGGYLVEGTIHGVNGETKTVKSTFTVIGESFFSGKFSINLYWANNGTDMDSHMYFKNSSGSELGHLYYGNKNVYGCSLDRDDTSGGTGEWLTIDFSAIPSNVDRIDVSIYGFRGSAYSTMYLKQEQTITDWTGKTTTTVLRPVTLSTTVNYHETASFGYFKRAGNSWNFYGYDGTVVYGSGKVSS